MSKPLLFLALGVVLFVGKPKTCLSQGGLKKTYTAQRITQQTPNIDGVLDDATWQNQNWGGNFTQTQPHDGQTPSQKTEFMIQYDDNFLYAAFKMYDTEPSKIVGRITRRDDIEGDWVALGIDSYNDKRTAFGFVVNAAGSKLDLMNTENGDREDSNWDPIWFVKTARFDWGWSAEMKIPLNQLRFKVVDDMTWGLEIIRNIYRIQEESMWQHIPKDSPGFVHMFGELKGLEGLKPKRQIEVAPYIVAKTESFKAEEGNPYATGKRNSFNVGIDSKIGLTNNLTLDLTVNPDFGQVEADPASVNLSAFETYFVEKRPFFIEGNNVLSFPLSFGDGDNAANNLFYSRRIGRTPQLEVETIDNEFVKMPSNTPILGAAKVTGRTHGGMSLGFLESLTANTYALIDSLGKEKTFLVEPLTNYSVGTLKQEFNNGNTIVSGLITSTNRHLNEDAANYLHKNAYSGGVDIQHNWKDKKYQISGKFYASRVEGSTEAILLTQESPARYLQRPDRRYATVDSSRTALNGTGGVFNFGKFGKGHLRYMAMVSWTTPLLEINDIGFIQNVDDIFQAFWVGLRYWEPKGIFKNVDVNFNQWSGWNFDGQSTYKGGNVNLNLQFTNFWYFSSGINIQGSGQSSSALRGGPLMKIPESASTWYNISTDDRKQFVVGAGGFTQISAFNYSFNQDLYLNFSYKPLRNLVFRMSPGYTVQKSNLQYVENPDFGQEKRYIRASLDQTTFNMSFRAEYSFSPNLSIQYFARPYLTSGTYSDYKYVLNPSADNYFDRFVRFTQNQVSYNSDNEEFDIDENGDGIIDYSFSDRNFDYLDLQSTLVARWEYRPGSTLFFVWTHGKNSYDSSHSSSLADDIDNLFSTVPHNIFLVKFSYRFN